MNMLGIFAHGEEFHGSGSGDGLEHLLTSAPVAIPLYILVSFFIFWAVGKWRKTAAIPSLLLLNLVIGLTLYEMVPALSIISITVGISLVLVYSLSLLASE